MTIDPYRLEATLLVAPHVPFARIERALAALGWERDPHVAPVTPDVIPGETEIAAWRWRGGRPRTTYTFNPVAQLRALDVGAVPPAMRAELARALPMLWPEEIPRLLGSADPRDRLRGVFAARELEHADLAPRLAALQGDPERAVAEVAVDAAKALGRVRAARVSALATLALVRGAAEPVARSLCAADPASALRDLRPAAGDYAKLFDESLAPEVARRCEEVWRAPSRWLGAPTAGPIAVDASPAGMFRSDNELSRAFPRGYRDVAGWMDPHRVWVTWRGTAPGAPPSDGLAWLGDRWVWCPKPWILLSGVVPGTDRPQDAIH